MIDIKLLHFSFLPAAQRGPWLLHYRQRSITVGRTPLDEWSASHRDLYLPPHNTHNRKTSMPQSGFEHAISTGERPQTQALGHAATWTGPTALTATIYMQWLFSPTFFLIYAFSSARLFSVRCSLLIVLPFTFNLSKCFPIIITPLHSNNFQHSYSRILPHI